MDDKPRRFVVGYALLPKKQASFIQKSLVEQASERGIDLVPVDPNKPLVDQGPFDCILHKLYGEDWQSQLHEFSVRFPTAPIIDPPVAIERLHNRISMLQVVADVKIKEENETFGIPKQTVIYDAETLGSLTGLEFPVIAKPLVADGSAKSHKMSLIFNSTGLSKLKPPIVLQEFVNHGGVIFKVYVAGEYVRCVKRRSLPDVSQEKMLSSVGSMSFSQISNMAQNHTQEYYESTELKSSEMPPLSFLTEIARELRKAMDLNLFNFDVIRDVKIGTRYLVIDINYFPGYAKMPGYEEVLTEFFWDLFHPKPNGDPSEEDGSTSMKTIGNGTS